MIKIIKKIIRLNQHEDKIYEEMEQVTDFENGNLLEEKKEYYQSNPFDKTTFDQFMIMEQEKTRLLESSAFNKSLGMAILKQFMGIKAIKKLKTLQKKLLGE